MKGRECLIKKAWHFHASLNRFRVNKRNFLFKFLSPAHTCLIIILCVNNFDEQEVKEISTKIQSVVDIIILPNELNSCLRRFHYGKYMRKLGQHSKDTYIVGRKCWLLFLFRIHDWFVFVLTLFLFSQSIRTQFLFGDMQNSFYAYTVHDYYELVTKCQSYTTHFSRISHTLSKIMYVQNKITDFFSNLSILQAYLPSHHCHRKEFPSIVHLFYGWRKIDVRPSSSFCSLFSFHSTDWLDFPFTFFYAQFLTSIIRVCVACDK